MKKIFFAALAFVLVAGQPVFGQYGRGYGMDAGAWLATMIFGLISFVIGSFIFSWIFWMVAKNMFEGKMMEKENWKMKMREEIKTENKEPCQKQ